MPEIELLWSVDDVIEYSKRWALTHGLLCLVPNECDQATFVPYTLFPSCLSQKEFEFIWNIQADYNLLYTKISQNDDILKKALESVIPIDDFVARLWNIYLSCKTNRQQPIQLDIYRNDYMYDTQANDKSQTKMRQIEFNTISSAFAGLTGIISQLHKAIFRYSIRNCTIRDIELNSQQQESSDHYVNFMVNNAVENAAKAIAKAYELYNNPESCILFVILPNERNVCDQGALYDAIQKQIPNVKIYLKTFKELVNEIQLNQNNNLCFKNSKEEISIVYYRAGYIPDHYFDESIWNMRKTIEQSNAIKCPTVHSQLAGCKIVQEYLTRPNILESFISNSHTVEKIRSTFAPMFTFDTEDVDYKKNIALLLSKPDNYVLKPQREGGGNNVFGQDILQLLSDKKVQLSNYIAMEKIVPPVSRNCLIKPNGKHLINAHVINEIGIYGTT
ncbi:unnamed protein product, partial [Didymodactylos carnosus]